MGSVMPAMGERSGSSIIMACLAICPTVFIAPFIPISKAG
jgi:hypothetical protein